MKSWSVLATKAVLVTWVVFFLFLNGSFISKGTRVGEQGQWGKQQKCLLFGSTRLFVPTFATRCPCGSVLKLTWLSGRLCVDLISRMVESRFVSVCDLQTCPFKSAWWKTTLLKIWRRGFWVACLKMRFCFCQIFEKGLVVLAMKYFKTFFIGALQFKFNLPEIWKSNKTDSRKIHQNTF